MHRLILIGVLAHACLCPVPSQAEELDQEILNRGLSSTVFIKSERVYRGLYYPGWGTGFFVHPDGYVLTNWHVVADQIEVSFYGENREITTKVIKLEVVINSGQPEERVLAAKIVARDRERDLALLHVRTKPTSWLEIVSPPQPALAQPIWLVGYPLGIFLSTDVAEGSMKLEDVPNPTASINRGMITSMRRDTTGRLKALQIDAAVNPGNSGGPLLDHQGRVVGVVNSKITGAEGLGFAISSTLLKEFATAKSARITFKPSSVYRSPATPIQVTIEPILVHLGDARGRIRFEGDGVAPIEVDLEQNGPIWTAEIPVPELVGGAPDPAHYVVELSFTRPDKSTPLKRRFKLKSSTAALRVASQRDPGKMLEDRKEFSNEMAISDYTKSGSVSGKNTRSLSDVAGDIKLKRSESGSIVIDNQTLAELNSPLETTFPDERYDQIESAAHQTLARDYDLLEWINDEIEKRLRLISGYLNDSDYRLRNAARQADRDLRRLKPQFESEFREVRDYLRQVKLVFCPDVEKWFYSHSAVCDQPVRP